jgi:ubiquitin-conjugating enzyme E2 D/E
MKGKELIQKELNEFLENPDIDDTFGIDYWDDDNPNVLNWKITMYGPEGTLYEGGYFLIKVDFTEKYPDKKPEVCFKTKIYHTNVNQRNGHVCISTLNNWEYLTEKPTMKNVLEDISFLLWNQNAKAGYSDFQNEYINNISEFERKAKQWVKEYANVEDYDNPEKNYK